MADPKDFFKKGDSSMGTFYPTHYIVAAYPDMPAAEAAAAAFDREGFADEDVRAAEGNFVIDVLQSREDSNLLERAQHKLVKFVGTEQGYVREDIELARSGGAFVFAYAPDEEQRDAANRVFAQHAPVYARRYLNVAIEVMVPNPAAA